MLSKHPATENKPSSLRTRERPFPSFTCTEKNVLKAIYRIATLGTAGLSLPHFQLLTDPWSMGICGPSRHQDGLEEYFGGLMGSSTEPTRKEAK